MASLTLSRLVISTNRKAATCLIAFQCPKTMMFIGKDGWTPMKAILNPKALRTIRWAKKTNTPLFPSEAEIDEILFPETGKINTIKTVFTPFGMLPLTEQSLASTHFKFWVGHTNFKLIRSFYSVIGRVKGVEAIDIFTPYRFRIAIGKLFRDRDVMSGVRKKMLEHLKVKNCPKNVP